MSCSPVFKSCKVPSSSRINRLPAFALERRGKRTFSLLNTTVPEGELQLRESSAKKRRGMLLQGAALLKLLYQQCQADKPTLTVASGIYCLFKRDPSSCRKQLKDVTNTECSDKLHRFPLWGTQDFSHQY